MGDVLLPWGKIVKIKEEKERIIVFEGEDESLRRHPWIRGGNLWGVDRRDPEELDPYVMETWRVHRHTWPGTTQSDMVHSHGPHGNPGLGGHGIVTYEDIPEPKEQPDMNSVQRKTFDHLISGGAERKQALEDLIARDFFNQVQSEGRCEKIATAYLSLNPRGFCMAGIDRFRKAVLAPNVETYDVVLRVTIDPRLDGGKTTDITASAIANNLKNHWHIGRQIHEVEAIGITEVKE